jgi:hypothetical protein
VTKLLFRSSFIALLIACCFAPKYTHAESYAVYAISGDNGYNLIGINAAGDVVIESSNGCSINDPNRCYETFSNGQLISESDTLTDFTPDNGTPCSYSAPSGVYLVGRSVCNDGQQVAGVLNGEEAEILALTSGGGGLGNFVLNGSADVLFVNSSGDFLVTDGADDTILQVIATPEPAGVILLSTATFGIIWAARCRFTRALNRQT